jgi:adenosylmethionine-8-amino-7-oxononanoate aminotransferase
MKKTTNAVDFATGIQRMNKYVVHPWASFDAQWSPNTVIKSGEGVYVYDSDGKRLLDGPGGMWCVNAGHGRQEIIDAMADQAGRLSYISPWSHLTEPAVRLAERLAAISPGDLNRVFYTTGGSTAVDSALRFVMFYNNVRGLPNKKHILTRHDAYHGSTYLSASVSGKSRDKNWLDFETSWIHHLSSPNPYRRADGMSEGDFCDYLVDELEGKILELGPVNTAAFIAEPILASGGVIVPPTGYHARCLDVCRQYDVLYISDEVVTGFGRLGHWFASEEVFDIVPDIITVAKGITSGYVPLGAVLISERLIKEVGGEPDRDAAFANGFTYSGHPVACAAALANLDLIKNDQMLENARHVGPYLQEKLRELIDLPIVGDVRGLGLMGCLECSVSKGSRQPLELDYDIGKRIDSHCQARGLLLRPLINMCVVSPPIVISREQVDEMLEILRVGIEHTMVDLEREGIALFN